MEQTPEFKIQFSQKTADLIKKEIDSIPLKYQKPFNSTHEGYAVLLEEVREIEHVVFFGEKEAKEMFSSVSRDNRAQSYHKQRLQEEAVQIAAMAIRIIEELTY